MVNKQEKCFKRSHSMSEVDQSYGHLRSPVQPKKQKPHIMPKPKGLFRRASEVIYFPFFNRFYTF